MKGPRPAAADRWVHDDRRHASVGAGLNSVVHDLCLPARTSRERNVINGERRATIDNDHPPSRVKGAAHGSQVDYFLKITGIDGESKDHEAQGRDRAPVLVLGRDAVGHVRHRRRRRRREGLSMQDFHFVDEGQQGLAEADARRARPASTSRTRSLTCRKAGKDQQEYLKIKFTDLIVSSYQTGGSARRHRPDRPDLAELREDARSSTRSRRRTAASAARPRRATTSRRTRSSELLAIDPRSRSRRPSPPGEGLLLSVALRRRRREAAGGTRAAGPRTAPRRLRPPGTS